MLAGLEADLPLGHLVQFLDRHAVVFAAVFDERDAPTRLLGLDHRLTHFARI